MLQAPKSPAGNPIGERILVYGGPDSGKTHNLLTIADWYHKTNTEGRFYVIATDMSYDRMLGPGGDFEHLTNVDYITGSFSSPPPAIGGRPGEPRQVGFYMTVAR